VKKPPVRYLVASPRGDFIVDNSRLDYPLEGDPLRTTYRAYFRAITDVLSEKHFQPLLNAVNERLGTDYNASAIQEILVRTEKHGALSHPASIECILQGQSVKFGLHVAVTDTGKDALRREFGILKMLHSRFSFKYIPVPYFLDERYSMVFLLEEWFEGYHEFHIAQSEDGEELLEFWEYGKRNRFLTQEQGYEIYRQAARILTLYYDLHNFRLIYPWHHAAGDFVARIEEAHSPSHHLSPQGKGDIKDIMNDAGTPSPLAGEGGGEGDLKDKIDVKLTTVRGYEPFMGSGSNEMTNPLLALFYFLLHLSIQMRLDKLNGVGDVAWAEDSCVDATMKGFFEGLERKNDFRESFGSTESFLMLLKSFTRDNLRKTTVPIAAQFERTKDYRVILEHLDDHTDRLYLTLQNFPL